MTPLPPSARKALLALHVATSVGLMGAVAAFLVLAILGAAPGGGLAVAVYPAMDILARFLILPLTWVALGVGILQSLATRWGLVRHWWVVAKLILSGFALGVLLLQMGGIRLAANAALDAAQLTDLVGLRWSFVIHAAGGLVVLSSALVLSIYKPAGRTGWGRLDR